MLCHSGHRDFRELRDVGSHYDFSCLVKCDADYDLCSFQHFQKAHTDISPAAEDLVELAVEAETTNKDNGD